MLSHADHERIPLLASGYVSFTEAISNSINTGVALTYTLPQSISRDSRSKMPLCRSLTRALVHAMMESLPMSASVSLSIA